MLLRLHLLIRFLLKEQLILLKSMQQMLNSLLHTLLPLLNFPHLSKLLKLAKSFKLLMLLSLKLLLNLNLLLEERHQSTFFLSSHHFRELHSFKLRLPMPTIRPRQLLMTKKQHKLIKLINSRNKSRHIVELLPLVQVLLPFSFPLPEFAHASIKRHAASKKNN